MDRIKVISGDTDTCPYDAGAVGSRTSLAMGVAVHQAIEGVKERLLQFAETQLEAPREILTFSDGKIIMKENPASSIPIARAARKLIAMSGGPVVATGSNTITHPQYYVFGAQAAAVEVDWDTGKVDILKVIAVHDVGKAIFIPGVEGQIQGGVAMGLGYALSEEVIFSDGRPVNDSFLDYRMPTTVDVPEIIPVILEKENPRIPDDIRGVGEPPTAPTAAAVANAVYDAVGIRMNHLPLTPERVYWGLKNKNGDQ
jgi:xanthine dehydrogenase molybdenum-binding subunit